MKAIIKFFNTLTDLITKIEVRLVKRGGTYIVIEELKIFGKVVESVEHKVKDVVVSE